MSTSVLAAGMFALLTHVIPTATGRPVIQVPDVPEPKPMPRRYQRALGMLSGSSANGDSESDSEST